MKDINKLAEKLHEKYEELSSELDWDTQEKCKVKFEDLPKENKKVMKGIAAWLIDYFGGLDESM